MSDKYEKFLTGINSKVDSLVNNIESSKSSDAFIFAYIKDNRHNLRRIAASKRLDDRQRDMFNLIEREVRQAAIFDYNEKTIYEALRSIGIHSDEKTYVILAFSIYFILIVISTTIYLTVDATDGLLIYIASFLYNLVITILFTVVIVAFTHNSKFRLFMVKK